MGNPIESLLIKVLEGATALMKGHEKQEIIKDALLIGEANHLYQPKRKEGIYISVSDRLRHLYILGATGTGKSKLLEFLIRQDILSGRGLCFIDPHGDLYQNILDFLAGYCSEDNNPEMTEKISKRLVLIDPACKEWVMGFNPLEAIGVNPYTQALEFMGILKKLWSDAYWGPRMEELMRNTMVTLCLHGYTLLEAKTLLTDPLFRGRLVADLPEGEVKEYWLYRYNQLSDRMQNTYREPILNRLSVFLSDPSIRIMVGQKESTINFRQIMDQGKWLLVNLSKGRLKSNAHLLGAFLVAKLQLSALSRVDVDEEKRFPFFLFVDEFQNFMSEDFETILSEARKYGLGLTLVHQNMDQLGRQLRAAILGNTLTQVFFRISNQDATALAAEIGQREKPIIQRRLVNLNQREAYIKKKGEQARVMKSLYVSPPKGTRKNALALKELSMSYHARPRKEVEQEIANRIHLISGEGETPKRYNPDNDPYKGEFAPRESYEEAHDW
jgi:type IV secretory system conjugative DNA transfer VirD4/TraG family protein/uncharacterized protein DUF87